MTHDEPADAALPPRGVAITRDVLQALLLICVIGWVLDVPTWLFGGGFYTEQMLAISLGLGLALSLPLGARPPAYPRLVLRGGLARHLRLHRRPLRRHHLRDRAVAARSRRRRRHPHRSGAGSDPPLVRRRVGRHHPGNFGLRLHRPAYARRFRYHAGVAAAADRLSRPRHQRHDRRHLARCAADRGAVHADGTGARPHRRRRLFRRSRDVGDGPLPRRRRQDRRVRLCPVRHDLGRGGEQRGGGRRRHHSADVALGLFADAGRGDRSRSAPPAAN